MTRKDFELIAATLKPAVEAHPGEGFDLARDFADALAGTNPHFDRARFLVACGVAP